MTKTNDQNDYEARESGAAHSAANTFSSYHTAR